ncbi:hypothetical protein [Mucilaginibacter sp.]|uniref:hypothetical protein n=1 Tax=Mucilaginibacter sp. TaxID=1882438 RepID=UPI0025F8E75F|nr:hypothetical protein [Mucilaginibacter sp.]
MKPLFHSITGIMLLSVLLMGCTSNSTNKCGPCPAIATVLPNINFRIVDKTTGEDLFFAPSPKFKIGQLKLRHIINGKPDSVFLRVDSAGRKFNIFVPPSGPIDTVTMQVADKPQDLLLFKTGKTPGCCSFLVLSSVTYNGNVVYTRASGPDVAVLTK